MAFVTDSLTELLVTNDPDEVYIVLINTKGGGEDAQVFAHPHEALKFARDTAHEICRQPDDYEEQDYRPFYFFYISCGPENDYVCILERKLR